MTNTLALIRAELSALRPLRDFTNAQPSDHLVDDLSLDSLDRVTLAIALEETLHLDLPDHVVAKWQTVADVVRSCAV